MRVVATEILNVYINFEYDVESGLYHLRARHYSPETGIQLGYNPETGTFISPDPIERGRQSCEQPKRDGVNKTNEEVKKCKEEIVGPIDILLDIELFPDTDPLTKDIRR